MLVVTAAMDSGSLFNYKGVPRTNDTYKRSCHRRTSEPYECNRGMRKSSGVDRVPAAFTDGYLRMSLEKTMKYNGLRRLAL